MENINLKRNNELELAKRLVADKNTNLKALSKETKIPYPSLKAYRYNLKTLNNARRVELLANISDKRFVKNTMTDKEIAKTKNKLSSMFDNWLMDSAKDKQKNAIIKRMRTIILSDPVAVAELFKASKGIEN